MDWKKVIIASLLLILGVFAHLFFSFASVDSIFGISILVYLAMVLLFVWKDYQKMYLAVIIVIIALQSAIMFIHFPACQYAFEKDGYYIASVCDCQGLTKTIYPHNSECIGIRKACYKFSEEGFKHERINMDNIDTSKIEFPCAELDANTPK